MQIKHAGGEGRKRGGERVEGKTSLTHLLFDNSTVRYKL